MMKFQDYIRRMRLSVIIPTYKGIDTISRAIDSVLAQADVVDELLIIDNNPGETTEMVLRAYLEHPPVPISLIREKAQGAARARNVGIRKAQGEWIQFLDDDDELLPGKIARQLDLVLPTTDWVMGKGEMVNPDGSSVVLELSPEPWKGLVFNGGLGDMNSSLFRRKTLLDLGGQNEDLVNGVDMEMYFRLLQYGANWIQDHERCSYYYNHDGFRLSRQVPRDLVRRDLELKVAVRNYLENKMEDYYKSNKAFFETAILRGISRQFSVDEVAGTKSYRKYFSTGLPKALDVTVLPNGVLVFLYKLIGFPNTELLRSRLRRLIR